MSTLTVGTIHPHMSTPPSHNAWCERRRKLCAEVPVDSLVYEITGDFRLGKFVWVVATTPVRVVRVGGWGHVLVVRDDANPRETRFCLHWARRAPPP